MNTSTTMHDFATYGIYTAEMNYRQEKRMQRLAIAELRGKVTTNGLRDRIGSMLIQLGTKLEGKPSVAPQISHPTASYL
jgi:hypothetical protein